MHDQQIVRQLFGRTGKEITAFQFKVEKREWLEILDRKGETTVTEIRDENHCN